jgi:hypothetical protein
MSERERERDDMQINRCRHKETKREKLKRRERNLHTTRQTEEWVNRLADRTDRERNKTGLRPVSRTALGQVFEIGAWPRALAGYYT